MTRTCFLHLGMNKAGSSSIQDTFHTYRDERVEYLRLGQPNHSRHISMRFLDKVQKDFYSSPDPAAQEAERAALNRRFDEALAATDRDVIVSAEYFSIFPDTKTCRKAIACFERAIGPARGLMYVRDPQSFIGSALQQAMKTIMPRPDLDGYYPGYRDRLLRWHRAFGDDRLDFVLFHRSAFHEGDLLLDFAQRVGIPAPWVERRRAQMPTSNESLSAEATAAVLRLRRARGPAEIHGPMRKANTTLVHELRHFGSRRFAIAPETLAPIVARHATDIRWIEKRLGRPFPAVQPRPDALLFAGLDDLDAYGATLAPDFADWQRRTWPDLPVKGTSIEEMMANVLDHLAHRFA